MLNRKRMKIQIISMHGGGYRVLHYKLERLSSATTSARKRTSRASRSCFAATRSKNCSKPPALSQATS
ncbi:hypothetical protein [uncultured Cloacibacillus sp.]|uniref:hypothetical protein n=1 Tax=uncultured Cloacibacillus sp. TaxID=889794 RepID=UPI003207F5E8